MVKSVEIISVENEALLNVESFAQRNKKDRVSPVEWEVNGWIVLVSYYKGQGMATAMRKVGE